MAANTNINWEPPKLDLSVDRYAAFTSWNERWDDYAMVTKLKDEQAEYRCSMLRYTFTEDTRKIYNTLGLTEAEAKDDKVIITKLKEFAKGTVNTTLERHTFYTRYQEEGECFDDFITDLKYLSKNCSFCNTNCEEGMLRDKIVEGILDSTLRQKLLSDSTLDLKKAEDTCRAKEKAIQGAKMLKNNKETRGGNADVDELTRRFNNNKTFQQQQPWQTQGRGSRREGGSDRRDNNKLPRSKSETPCKFCARLHKWGRQFCPAWDQKCTACFQKNHTKESSLCRKKKNIRNINQYDEDTHNITGSQILQNG